MIKEVPYYKTEPFQKDAKQYGVMFKENTNYWGLYKKKVLVGVVGYDLQKNGKAVLRSDYVIPEERKNGVYLELNKFRMDLLESKGVREMTITCTENSLPLHLRLGAVPIKKYKKYTKLKYYL